eukprot:TRINITY_DN100520_c0_g1_i1.p1 TRINITY_DN100520_c0_g1~~TRINITY_DN100520_c0_g1_i1.p1  ORF type:complete len:170 (+),score=24.80 TRINITY_DN100520_c0_g1_i1:61-510(+)
MELQLRSLVSGGICVMMFLALSQLKRRCRLQISTKRSCWKRLSTEEVSLADDRGSLARQFSRQLSAMSTLPIKWARMSTVDVLFAEAFGEQVRQFSSGPAKRMGTNEPLIEEAGDGMVPMRPSFQGRINTLDELHAEQAGARARLFNDA